MEGYHEFKTSNLEDADGIVAGTAVEDAVSGSTGASRMRPATNEGKYELPYDARMPDAVFGVLLSLSYLTQEELVGAVRWVCRDLSAAVREQHRWRSLKLGGTGVRGPAGIKRDSSAPSDVLSFLDPEGFKEVKDMEVDEVPDVRFAAVAPRVIRMPSLLSLRLRATSGPASALNRALMPRLDVPALVRLQFCGALDNESLMAITKAVPRVETLDVDAVHGRQASPLSAPILAAFERALTRRCPRLETVRVRGVGYSQLAPMGTVAGGAHGVEPDEDGPGQTTHFMWGRDALAGMLSQPKIRSIEFGFAHDGMFEALQRAANPSFDIEHLHLGTPAHYPAIQPVSYEILFRRLGPALRSLVLHTGSVNDEVLEAIGRLCPSITKLDVVCPIGDGGSRVGSGLSNTGLIALSRGCSMLQDVRIVCMRLDRPCWGDAGVVSLVKELQDLRSLQLVTSAGLTDDGARALADHLPARLRVLSLQQATNLTKGGVHALLCGAVKQGVLEHLNLSMVVPVFLTDDEDEEPGPALARRRLAGPALDSAAMAFAMRECTTLRQFCCAIASSDHDKIGLSDRPDRGAAATSAPDEGCTASACDREAILAQFLRRFPDNTAPW